MRMKFKRKTKKYGANKTNFWPSGWNIKKWHEGKNDGNLRKAACHSLTQWENGKARKM